MRNEKSPWSSNRNSIHSDRTRRQSQISSCINSQRTTVHSGDGTDKKGQPLKSKCKQCKLLSQPSNTSIDWKEYLLDTETNNTKRKPEHTSECHWSNKDLPRLVRRSRLDDHSEKDSYCSTNKLAHYTLKKKEPRISRYLSKSTSLSKTTSFSSERVKHHPFRHGNFNCKTKHGSPRKYDPLKTVKTPPLIDENKHESERKLHSLLKRRVLSVDSKNLLRKIMGRPCSQRNNKSYCNNKRISYHRSNQNPRKSPFSPKNSPQSQRKSDEHNTHRTSYRRNKETLHGMKCKSSFDSDSCYCGYCLKLTNKRPSCCLYSFDERYYTNIIRNSLQLNERLLRHRPERNIHNDRDSGNSNKNTHERKSQDKKISCQEASRHKKFNDKERNVTNVRFSPTKRRKLSDEKNDEINTHDNKYSLNKRNTPERKSRDQKSACEVDNTPRRRKMKDEESNVTNVTFSLTKNRKLSEEESNTHYDKDKRKNRNTHDMKSRDKKIACQEDIAPKREKNTDDRNIHDHRDRRNNNASRRRKFNDNESVVANIRVSPKLRCIYKGSKVKQDESKQTPRDDCVPKRSKYDFKPHKFTHFNHLTKTNDENEGDVAVINEVNEDSKKNDTMSRKRAYKVKKPAKIIDAVNERHVKKRKVIVQISTAKKPKGNRGKPKTRVKLMWS